MVYIPKKSKIKTREAIVEMAGCLFAEKGFRVTTREIAEASGTNIGSISYYFGNKEGLIEAVLDHATRGWKRHDDVVDYIINTSGEFFETPRGRLQILTNVYQFLFQFYLFGTSERKITTKENSRQTLWRVRFLHSILYSQSKNNPYKKKLIERVIEPNRKSFERLVLKLCPDLSQVEVYIDSAQFFLAPILHYSIIDLSQPFPFDPSRSPLGFLNQACLTLARSFWLTLEQRRHFQVPLYDDQFLRFLFQEEEQKGGGK